MFKLQELSNLIENQLNSAGENFSPAYSFRIFTEIGKNAGSSYINCVLRQQKPSVSVVPNVINNTYILVLDVVVPANTVNFNLANVQEIFNGVIENVNGKEQEFKDGKGIVTFTLADTGNFKTEYGQGNIVPISYNIFVNYAENVVLDKHYLLNGQEIPFTYDELLIEKDGITKSIYGEEYQKSFVTLQRKFFHFRMPKSTTIATNLIADILNGQPNQEYTLTYYDGDKFTQQAPFTTKVAIFRTANARSQRPQTTELDITFAEVDDETSLTIYELALIDNQFDADSENTRYFESQEQQQTYFEDYIENYGADWDRIKVPNLNSIDLTNQIYKNTNNYDLFDLVNKNYAIIKVTQNSGLENEKVNYFYYFVNSAQIGLYNQVSYDLKLDTLQTYYFNEHIEFNGTFINKAHLNRWIDNGDGTISFNGVADSDLFEREEIKQVAKRLVYKERLIFDTSNLIIPTISRKNIYDIAATPVWCYIFLDGRYLNSSTEIKYNFVEINKSGSFTFTQKSLDRAFSNNINTPTAIIAYPLNEDLYIGNLSSEDPQYNINIETNLYAWHMFVSANPTIFSYIKSIKLSIKPPININELKYTGNITLNTDKVSGSFETNGNQQGITGYPEPIQFLITSPKEQSGQQYRQTALLYIEYDNITPFEMKLSNNSHLPKLTFTKIEANISDNENLNPKLNSVDYKELILRIGGSEHILDYQKLNDENPIFQYLEPLSCDTTKALIRFKSKSNNNIFNEYSNISLNGLLYTNDLSLPIANDQLSNYLANNKNAYLSFQNQQHQIAQQAVVNSITSGLNTSLNSINNINQAKPKELNDAIASGNMNMINMGVNTAGQMVSTGMNLYYNQLQYNLSIDNMKNAPTTISNANGSSLFINTVEEYGLYLELYEGIYSEIKSINNIMHQNGYTYNKIDNLKNFDNIRKYFNYIKAIIGNISGIPMSNVARNDLRQRFINGVRFWNIDNVNYNVNNIEKEFYLVYNMRYNNECENAIITYQPTQIEPGIFKTQILFDSTEFGINYEFYAVINNQETLITYGILYNSSIIQLDTTNNDYYNYFKNSLIDDNYIKLKIEDREW